MRAVPTNLCFRLTPNLTTYYIAILSRFLVLVLFLLAHWLSRVRDSRMTATVVDPGSTRSMVLPRHGRRTVCDTRLSVRLYLNIRFEI